MKLPPYLHYPLNLGIIYGEWAQMTRQSLEDARETDCPYEREACLRVARRRAAYARERYQELMRRHGL